MTEPSLAEQLNQPPRVLVAVAEQVGAELGLGFLRELGSWKSNLSSSRLAILPSLIARSS